MIRCKNDFSAQPHGQKNKNYTADQINIFVSRQNPCRLDLYCVQPCWFWANPDYLPLERRFRTDGQFERVQCAQRAFSATNRPTEILLHRQTIFRRAFD